MAISRKRGVPGQMDDALRENVRQDGSLEKIRPYERIF